jgi:formate dehydrogenase subunit gamma
VADLKGRPGPLLEVLHAIQVARGYVPSAAVPVVADGLNLSRVEVHGVVTFYHYFRHTAPGKHTVSLCRAEASSRGTLPLQLAGNTNAAVWADRLDSRDGGHRPHPGGGRE